jgi:hypothetical protein
MKIVDSNIMNNRKGIGSTNYNVILSALPTAIISHMTIPMKPLDSILFQVKIPGMHDFHCYIACNLYREEIDYSGAHSRSAILWYDHRFCILLLTSSHLYKILSHSYIYSQVFMRCCPKNTFYYCYGNGCILFKTLEYPDQPQWLGNWFNLNFAYRFFRRM